MSGQLGELVWFDACPPVDGLIIVPCHNHVFCAACHLEHDLPLQRRQILCLVDNQQLKFGRVANGQEPVQHVGKRIPPELVQIFMHQALHLVQDRQVKIILPSIVDFLRYRNAA